MAFPLSSTTRTITGAIRGLVEVAITIPILGLWVQELVASNHEANNGTGSLCICSIPWCYLFCWFKDGSQRYAH